MQKNLTPTSQPRVDTSPNDDPKRKNKFSKGALQILNTWLYQNYEFPYPDCEEAKVLCRQTNLTLKQLRIWFINNRKVKDG